jgi:hypothetical protein
MSYLGAAGRPQAVAAAGQYAEGGGHTQKSSKKFFYCTLNVFAQLSRNVFPQNSVAISPQTNFVLKYSA